MSLAGTIWTHYAKLRQRWYIYILFSEILLKCNNQKITFKFFGIAFEPILSQRVTRSWPNVPWFWEESKGIVHISLNPGGNSCRWRRRHSPLSKALKNMWRATCMSALLDSHPYQCSTRAEDLEAMCCRKKSHLFHRNTWGKCILSYPVEKWPNQEQPWTRKV